MKFLVTSDLHLSDRIWRHRPIEGDSYHSWNQVVDLAIRHDVDGVIIAGDILDKQQNLSEPIQQLLKGLQRLCVARIPVYYNQGQHEYQQEPWMTAGANTVWLQREDFVTSEGWRIVGCDYQNAENLQAFLKSNRAIEADILVCHQVWQDFMGEVGNPQGEFADIRGNAQVLITGDYHEHICQKFGNLIVLSPGSTHMRSISEPEEHEVFLLTLYNPINKPVIQSLPLYTRRLLRLNTRDCPSFNELKKQTEMLLRNNESYVEVHKLPEELCKPLIQLTHRSEENELVQQFIQSFHALGHLFFKQVITDGNSEPEVIEYLDASDRVSLGNCLDQFIDAQKKPLIHSLAVSLLQSPDPEQALHRWLKELIDIDGKAVQ